MHPVRLLLDGEKMGRPSEFSMGDSSCHASYANFAGCPVKSRRASVLGCGGQMTYSDWAGGVIPCHLAFATQNALFSRVNGCHRAVAAPSRNRPVDATFAAAALKIFFSRPCFLSSTSTGLSTEGHRGGMLSGGLLRLSAILAGDAYVA